jgi:molecular chaperone DnaJ
MPKDYYFILGVHPDASPEQIELAYLERVRTLDPDDFETHRDYVSDIQEAYTFLHDPPRRAAYDRLLKSSAAEPDESSETGATSTAKEIDLQDSFATFLPSYEALFERIWKNFTSVSAPKSEKIESLTCEIILTPEEALRGGKIRLMVPARIPCAVCHGKGGIGPLQCWKCNGQGFAVNRVPLVLSYAPGTTNQVLEISLERYGIHNLYLIAYLRVGGGETS